MLIYMMKKGKYLLPINFKYKNLTKKIYYSRMYIDEFSSYNKNEIHSDLAC